MKKLFILITIMFLTGCATGHVFNVEEANTYLMSHRDRPPRIREALSTGSLAKGMNKEEVKICLGKPDEIVNKFVRNNKVTIWLYPKFETVGVGPRGRSIIKKALAKRVTFRNGAVVGWMEVNPSSETD